MVQCWAIDKKIEQIMSVAEMRMFRWMSEMSRKKRMSIENLKEV